MGPQGQGPLGGQGPEGTRASRATPAPPCHPASSWKTKSAGALCPGASCSRT